MAGLCEGGNEPSGSLKATCNQSVRKPEQASRLVYRSSTRVCVRNCISIRRPEFECSGPQLEGPEFECIGPQLEGPEFEYSELSLKIMSRSKSGVERPPIDPDALKKAVEAVIGPPGNKISIRESCSGL
ncbi:hypothetical protein ANN_27277 [Periplaneta americana]|uniref:Uncharacterized protein n=1 Tax=Periplaneta americana TaxID=6978 RepID=A0ABQ8RXK1_PERAM|nr:hypothetical protein ANN_27277 [Periplaneta americana]